MKNIYFLCNEKYNNGSNILRAHQISKKLCSKGVNSIVINDHRLCKNGIVIILKELSPKILMSLKKKRMIIIFDIIDSLALRYNDTMKMIKYNTKQLNGIIVNNNFMKKELSELLHESKIFIIPHHFDVRLENICSNIITQDALKFAYFGRHPEINTLQSSLEHYEIISNLYNLLIVDTCKSDLIEEIKNNISFFNCHMNIRKIDEKDFRYRTTAKLATASACYHNILTTYDESIKDILPKEYPFILESYEEKYILNMIEKMKDDFNGDKSLWNKGLDIIRNVKKLLDLENIIELYIDMLSKF